MRAFGTSLSWFNQVAFCAVQEAENELEVNGNQLNHCFLDLNQVEFWAVQDTENEFAVPGDLLNHRFINLTGDAFLAGQEA